MAPANIKFIHEYQNKRILFWKSGFINYIMKYFPLPLKEQLDIMGNALVLFLDEN